jgi:hypothetical protein
MSGVASGILSAITAAGQLFGGYGVVTLGPVVLGQAVTLELPESIPMGGKQALTIHKLPGGARVFDVMGQDDAPISWSGYLDGQTASTRARTLDKLRRSGTPITLAWDVYSYQVIVSEFSCDTRIPPMKYKITVEVVQDNTFVSGNSLVSMALQVTQDLATGNPIAALGSVSQGIVGSSVTNAAAAVGLPGATTVGSGLYGAAVNAIGTASTAIQSATSYANGILAPLGTSLGAISTVAPAALDTLGFSKQIQNAAGACSDLASLTNAAGFVSRAAANLKGASA